MQLVHRRRFPVDHYVLIDPEGLSTPGTLIAEARRQAEALALRSTGDARNFTLIQNGPGLARCDWPHVHIVCTRTRFRKGLIYLFIGFKNLWVAMRE
ncbi:MAG: hypothetical protein ACT4NL_04155 [Pseudomarimonas sp.]